MNGFFTDIAVIAIILMFAIIKGKKGFTRSVMSLVVVILALGIGVFAADTLTPAAGDKVWQKVEPSIEKKFDASMAGSAGSAVGSAEELADSWERLRESLGIFGLAINDAAHDGDNSTVDVIGGDNGKIIDDFDDSDAQDPELIQKLRILTLAKARMIVNRIVNIVLFIVFALIAYIALRVFRRIFGRLADKTFIGSLNHIAGFLLGAVEALVLMIVIVRGAGLAGVTAFDSMAQGTWLLQWIAGGDIQATLAQLQNLSLDDIRNIDLGELKKIGADKIDLSGLADKFHQVIGRIRG